MNIIIARRLRLGKALEKFIEQVQNNIEEKIPDWLNENPYWEIDGDDGLPERCPRTTSADAREELCDNFIAEGDNLGYGDFFEFVVSEAFDVSMNRKNIYRETKRSSEEQVNDLNQKTAEFVNKLFSGCFDD